MIPGGLGHHMGQGIVVKISTYMYAGKVCSPLAWFLRNLIVFSNRNVSRNDQRPFRRVRPK
jgi:hypothetical protein